MEINNNKNKKYDFKTLKIRPGTHKKIIRCKSKIEMESGSLVSFDKMINYLIEHFENNS